MRFHFVAASSNVKTGPIPVTMSEKETCPTTCPLKGSGCYAESGNVNIHWSKLSNGQYDTNKNVGGIDFLTDKIKALPKGQLWRMNAAGDLPHDNQTINSDALRALIDANKGKRGFTYTHHIVSGDTASAAVNRAFIKGANQHGFTINLSGNSPMHADELKALDIGPVVTIVDEWEKGQAKIIKTPGGNGIVICPAVTSDNVTCASCGLCANPDRKSIVGFPVHGTGKKKAKTIMLKAA